MENVLQYLGSVLFAQAFLFYCCELLLLAFQLFDGGWGQFIADVLRPAHPLLCSRRVCLARAGASHQHLVEGVVGCGDVLGIEAGRMEGLATSNQWLMR